MSKFQEASAEEISAWREQTVTKAFSEWLEQERDVAIEAQHTGLIQDRIGQARIAAGYVDALNRVIYGMHTAGVLPKIGDVSQGFVDSAARPKREVKK